MNEHHLLHELLPYRMQSVDTLNLAIRMRFRWPETPPSAFMSTEIWLSKETSMRLLIRLPRRDWYIVAHCWSFLAFA